MKKTFVLGLCIMIVDQIIKFFLISFVNMNESIEIIKYFFNISLVYNTGAAFSILTSKVTFLIIISVLVLIFLIFYIIKTKDLRKFDYIIYGFLIGGISGNLIDRIFRGAVIDYFDFNIFGYAFPVFNFADICIVISMFLIVIDMIRNDKNGIFS